MARTKSAEVWTLWRDRLRRVVDTGSMNDLADGVVRPGQSLKFAPNDGIHHVNYFDDKRTISFLRSSLSRSGLKF